MILFLSEAHQQRNLAKSLYFSIFLIDLIALDRWKGDSLRALHYPEIRWENSALRCRPARRRRAAGKCLAIAAGRNRLNHQLDRVETV
jgi:hypothetical protein